MTQNQQEQPTRQQQQQMQHQQAYLAEREKVARPDCPHQTRYNTLKLGQSIYTNPLQPGPGDA